MQLVRMNDIQRERTFQERLVDFIMRSVEAGHSNLAKLLVNHNGNPLSSLSKLLQITADIQGMGRSTPVQFLNSLYHRELQRMAYESKVNNLMNECSLDLNRMLLEQLGNYKEQLLYPTTELKSMINNMVKELYQGRVNKLIEDILDLNGIEDNTETSIWLDKHCFVIRKNGEEFTVISEGVSSFTDIIFEYTNEREESSRLIRALIKDSTERDELLEKQIAVGSIDVCSEDYIKLNNLLVNIKKNYQLLQRVISLDENQPLHAYCNYEGARGERVTRVHDLRGIIERQFLGFYLSIPVRCNCDLSYEENTKAYEKLSVALHKKRGIEEAKTTRIMKFRQYFEGVFSLKGVLSYFACLTQDELSALRNFLKASRETNILDEVSVLSLIQELPQANNVVDRDGNNLLHITLRCTSINEPFVVFLIVQKINIYLKNRMDKRPLDIAVQNCLKLSNNTYKILMEYAVGCIKSLFIDHIQITQSNTAIIAIKKMFTDIEHYVTRKHYGAVQHLKAAKVIGPRLRPHDKTRDRAVTISECFGFIHDQLANLPENALVDSSKLCNFLEQMLPRIQTVFEIVLPKERSELYRDLNSALMLMSNPLQKTVDEQCKQIRLLSGRVESLLGQLQSLERQHREQYEKMSKEHRAAEQRAQAKMEEMRKEQRDSEQKTQEKMEQMRKEQRESEYKAQEKMECMRQEQRTAELNTQEKMEEIRKEQRAESERTQEMLLHILHMQQEQHQQSHHSSSRNSRWEDSFDYASNNSDDDSMTWSRENSRNKRAYSPRYFSNTKDHEISVSEEQLGDTNSCGK